MACSGAMSALKASNGIAERFFLMTEFSIFEKRFV
jgi:hypothetical protein